MAELYKVIWIKYCICILHKRYIYLMSISQHLSLLASIMPLFIIYSFNGINEIQFETIILAVDRRSRVSTSIFTTGRSHQYLWSSNCISRSSLCCYIARQTLFIIAPYWINCMCLSVQKRAEYAYKVTASNCLSTDCKHEAYGRPLLIVFNGGIPRIS